MFETDNKKLGIRELVAIFIFSIAMECTEATSVLYIRQGGTSAWIMPIISYLTMLVPFLIVQSLLKEHKDKGLMDIINIYMGKYIGFFINTILFIMILSSIILTSRSYVDILITMYFPRTPNIAIYLGLIGLSCYGAIKGFTIIGRACLIALPYMIIVMIILVISIWKALDYRLALPIGGTGMLPVLKGGMQYSSILGSSVVLSIYFTSVKDFTKYKIASNIGLIISVIILIFFKFAFLAVFSFPYLKIMNYPFHELIRVSRLGGAIQNIEAFFLGFWLIGVVFHLSIYFCALNSVFNVTYKIKNSKVFLFLFAIIVIFIGLKINNESQLIFLYRSLQLTISSYIILILPIILFAAFKLKGGGSK
jgi:spore germination protein KB